jgi:hypothetical protein
MSSRASGTFEVKVIPQAADDPAGAPEIARMLLDKQFHGDLEAVGKGQMLAAGNGAKSSSGGYVAIEQVTGSLSGRSGSFALQHLGTMTRGVPHMTISVIPDSGTAELEGLTGNLTIKIEDGKHFYEFEYTLG